MLRLSGIRLLLDETEAELKQKAASLLQAAPAELKGFRIVKKSLDARRSRPPEWVYAVEFSHRSERLFLSNAGPGLKIKKSGESRFKLVKGSWRGKRPVVIGTGPAGMFCACVLARSGIPALVLERGRTVPERSRDTALFWEKGMLDPESNVHFGEGGAGTFSDGKLTTRVRNPRIEFVKRTFVELGADPAILTEAHPHIGTDRLHRLAVSFRQYLSDLGCEFRFQTKAADFLIRNSTIEGVVTGTGEEIRSGHVILAPGHSSVDTYEALLACGIELVPKPFAVGVRIEHPQELINQIRYGKWNRDPRLPPADYFLAARATEPERSVYSFCMCPGGAVIACSSEEGGVVTNGMSNSRRSGQLANSAIVVNVRVEDCPGDSPLRGILFRRALETKAFELAGGNYFAPAESLKSFLLGKGDSLPHSSYRPGVAPVPLGQVLPGFVTRALREGFAAFDRKMPGFISSEAVLIGVETRTSSPVRIARRDDGCATQAEGLYPCGEGAGYAGGIMSSALDGIRAAEAVISKNR